MDNILDNFLSTSVKYLPKVGPKRALLMEKLGIYTIRDILLYLPYDYIDRRTVYKIAESKSGAISTVIVQVTQHFLPYSKKSPYKIVCEDETGVLEVLFFHYNKHVITSLFPEKSYVLLSGKIEVGLTMQMLHPDIISTPDKLEEVAKVEPIYHASKGIPSQVIAFCIKNALNKLFNLQEWIPQSIIERFGWEDWTRALKSVHTPHSNRYLQQIEKAKTRLAFDEILAQQIKLMKIRRTLEHNQKEDLYFNAELYTRLLRILPFKLTGSQQQVINEIGNEQKSNRQMVRLLQGDVGSGKTVVALSAMLNAAEAGRQAVLMAPTEVLAKQHFANIESIARQLNLTTTLLVNALPEQEKKRNKLNIAMGDAQLIIGTHALFQKDINFKKLGLVVIDEQHRFGVDQRLALLSKAKNPDLLMMTATPIPRSLSMIAYGDMDTSTLKEKPAQRGTIITTMSSLSHLNSLIEKIVSAAHAGKKIYWLCPLIEESEKSALSDASQRYSTLLKLLDGKVGLVHGKLKSEERNKVMLDFKKGKISVLVTTTVIEVGVDVPDATIMVIENAERFGLSQLHQLRGRVGRGTKDSYCILLYKSPLSHISSRRLKTIRDSNDGFEIAEKDLQIRGSGDVLGTKQSGLPDFKVYEFGVHDYLLKDARQLALQLVYKEHAKGLDQLMAIYKQDSNGIKW